MTKFILALTLAFSIALFFIYHINDFAIPILDKLLTSFNILALLTWALSIALYTKVDGITKDISADNSAKSNTVFSKTITSLTNFKKEILVNAFALVGLFVFEKIASGMTQIFDTKNIAHTFGWGGAICLSIRGACFAIGIYVAVLQAYSFIIANEFRKVICGVQDED